MRRVIIAPGLAALSVLAGCGSVMAATHQLPWDGAPRLDIAVPGSVTITPGAAPRIVVSGPANAVDRVYIRDGRIRYRRSTWGWFGWSEPRGLKIEITAPSLAQLAVHSGSDVHLANFSGDALDLSVHSGADVTGAASLNAMTARVHSGADLRLEGRATRLSLIAHSGADADLGRMNVDHASVMVHSGADAVVNPRLSVNAEAHSGGDIRLLGRPLNAVVTSHSGGDVRMP